VGARAQKGAESGQRSAIREREQPLVAAIVTPYPAEDLMSGRDAVLEHTLRLTRKSRFHPDGPTEGPNE